MGVGTDTREQLEENHGIPGEKAITVAQATDRIEAALENDGLRAVHVVGEVGNCREWKDNLFFTIKDRQAKLDCVLFSRHIEDYRPEEGDRVLVRGSIDLYRDQGTISIRANTVIPLGEGRQYRKLRQLKRSLRESGLFERSQDIPDLPDSVGLITSTDADAFNDVRDAIHARNPQTDILHAPASVQGEGATDELIGALEELDSHDLDTIIIARGGGDLEALQPFNTRAIAEELEETDTPVVTGIGHRDDETIAGLAADHRAMTPTDAGQQATDDIETVIKDLNDIEDDIETAYQTYKNSKQQEKTIQKQERRERIYTTAIIALAGMLALTWWLI